MKKCGFVAVLGEANAGKSTLINALTGEKVSIVSEKPHTTRYDIYGIVCHKECQLILVDTPGLIVKPQGPLQSFMRKMTAKSLQEADCFLVVIDASRPFLPSLSDLLDTLAKQKKPLLIALNKIDRIDKTRLLPLAELYQKWTSSLFMISGKTGSGLPFLSTCLNDSLPSSPWLFPEEEFTQISQRLWAAELTREKLFAFVHQEIPYQSHVHTETWEEKSRMIRIEQTIFVTEEKKRKWILGYQGRRIRHIGQTAREELFHLLGKNVNLFLHVKVDPTWTKCLSHSERER